MPHPPHPARRTLLPPLAWAVLLLIAVATSARTEGDAHSEAEGDDAPTSTWPADAVVSLTLQGALWRSDGGDARTHDLDVRLYRREHHWRPSTGYASHYNKANHTVTVKTQPAPPDPSPAAGEDPNAGLVLHVNVKDDAWVRGGNATYRLTLARNGTAIGGRFTGSFGGREVAGTVVGSLRILEPRTIHPNDPSHPADDFTPSPPLRGVPIQTLTLNTNPSHWLYAGPIAPRDDPADPPPNPESLPTDPLAQLAPRTASAHARPVRSTAFRVDGEVYRFQPLPNDTTDPRSTDPRHPISLANLFQTVSPPTTHTTPPPPPPPPTTPTTTNPPGPIFLYTILYNPRRRTLQLRLDGYRARAWVNGQPTEDRELVDLPPGLIPLMVQTSLHPDDAKHKRDSAAAYFLQEGEGG